MRIAVLTNAYPPDAPGGAARIAAEQVRMLEEAGETVRVWHPKVAWFSAPPLLRLKHHLQDLKAREELVKEISDWKPEVLLTHNLTGCGFATPRAIQKNGARWVHVLHDIQLFEPSGQARNLETITLWQRLWSGLRKRALGLPDVIICPTAWLRDEHVRRGFFVGTQTEVLPNPSPAAEHVLRHAHVPLQLLSVGRVSEDKGSFLLARLVQTLRVPFELDVIGSGPVFTEDPRVRFHGPLDPEEVRKQMKVADIFLMPSQIVENQPTGIIEAVAYGLPVIASRIGGIPETLGGAGILCDPMIVLEWERAILSLLDEKMYQTTSEKMFEVAQRHDPTRYAQRFFALLKSNR